MSDLPRLASMAERIGQMKKKEIKKNIAQETGLKEKQIDKALPGVQSAFRGAQVAQEKGLDPRAVGVQGLQKMDPTRSPESDKKPVSSKEVNHQQAVTAALLTMLPGVVASIVGGTEAGEKTSNHSIRAGEFYINASMKQKSQENKEKERAEDNQRKDKAFGIQEKASQSLLDSRAHEMGHKNRMATAREREVSAREKYLASRAAMSTDENGNQILKPTKLSSQQTAKLTQLQAAKTMLDDAKKVILANKDAFSNPGIMGKVGNIKNTVRVNDPKLQSIETMLRKTALLTGQGIKGGSLTQEEGHQWEKELERHLPAETLLKKIEIFEKQVADQEEAFLNSAKINNQPVVGYEPSEKKELSLSEGDPVEQVPEKKELPPMPDFSEMTDEELKKYLDQKR